MIGPGTRQILICSALCPSLFTLTEYSSAGDLLLLRTSDFLLTKTAKRQPPKNSEESLPKRQESPLTPKVTNKCHFLVLFTHGPFLRVGWENETGMKLGDVLLPFLSLCAICEFNGFGKTGSVSSLISISLGWSQYFLS